jgi:hypothetical protein
LDERYDVIASFGPGRVPPSACLARLPRPRFPNLQRLGVQSSEFFGDLFWVHFVTASFPELGFVDFYAA